MVSRRLLALAASLAAPGAAFAHHSPAAFDMAQEITIEGTVVELAWKNPHVYFTVETTGLDGATRLQEVEGAAVSAVRTYGLTPEVLAVGSHVVVRANPSRRGEGRIVRGLDVAADDGAVYLLASAGAAPGREVSPPTATVPAESLAGRWVQPPATLEALRRASSAWPITEEARAAAAQAAQSSYVSGGCDPASEAIRPPPLLEASPVLREIVIGDEAVVIRFDSGAVRVVSLVETTHPADLEPSPLGHAIGRWEGETLVIDTAGFAPSTVGLLGGLPSGPGKHLVERLSLTEDRLHLEHAVTVEDPQYLAAPVSYALLWDHRPDLEPSDEPCDPEVAARYLEEADPQ